MAENNIDALILTTPWSVYYSTGFASAFLYDTQTPGLSVSVIRKNGDISLICSEFESVEAASCTEGVEIITYPMFVFIEEFADRNFQKTANTDLIHNLETAFEVACSDGTVQRIGIEKSNLTKYAFDEFEKLADRHGAIEYSEAAEIVLEAKKIKTPWEIDILRQGAIIAEESMNETGAMIEPGMTYGHISTLYQINCLKRSDDIVFVDQFHTFGKKFSPSYIMSTETVKTGDVLRLDAGPVVDGYYTDIARNFCVGGPEKMADTQKKIYEALWKGYSTARSMIGPGESMARVFRAVSNTVKENGIDNYLRGHHGHTIGCGPSAEEYPFLSADEENRIFEPGMVMCLEVPYYSAKNHSFNIEDMFLVTDNGVEFLTNSEPIV